MKTVTRWKQRSENFWTIRPEPLESQLSGNNHKNPQAFDERNRRVYAATNTVQTPTGSRTTVTQFDVRWKVENIDYSLKNVPQTIDGEVLNCPDDVIIEVPPKMDIWILESLPKFGEEPWMISIQTIEKPELTVAYYPVFEFSRFGGKLIVEGTSGTRVIPLPHLSPTLFRASSFIAEGVEVEVNTAQRILQIKTEPFEGKKVLCELTLSSAQRYDQSMKEFSYYKATPGTNNQFHKRKIDVYKFKGSDIPMIFGFSNPVELISQDEYNAISAEYKDAGYAMMESTMLPEVLPYKSSFPYEKDDLIHIQSRLAKVILGRKWDDYQLENTNPETQGDMPFFNMPGTKRMFEAARAVFDFFSHGGAHYQGLIGVTPGDFDPDTPGIYQPDFSLAFPDDMNNTYGFEPNIKIMVLNADQSEPPVDYDQFAIKEYAPLELIVPQHYPVGVLKNNFVGAHAYHAKFAKNKSFHFMHARHSFQIDWTDVKFDTSIPGTFIIKGKWSNTNTYAFVKDLEEHPTMLLTVIPHGNQLPVVPIEEPIVEIPLPNVNTCSETDFTGVPGIGHALAGRLIAGRDYETLESVMKVSGIGPSKYQAIKDHNFIC